VQEQLTEVVAVAVLELEQVALNLVQLVALVL
jgi:hypothetical protein